MLERGTASFKSPEEAMSPAALQRPSARRWIAIGSARRRWILNIVFLIAGFVIGQGAIFVVQSVLIAAGEYRLVAAFGTHYSFAIFAILAVDAGASVTLARTVARLPRGSSDEVWRIFCETSVIRLLLALLIGVAAAVFALAFSSEGFSRWYVALAFPGLMLWAFNGIGLLDGLKLSGVSGISGSTAYIMNAIGLVAATHKSPGMAGAILGGAFSIGYLLTLVAQWSVLGRKGWYPRYRRVTRAGLAVALKDSLAMLFQLGPGQLVVRVQLALSAAFLGTETTALFVYVRQVVTGLTQIIGFVLRVEFPGLVERLASPGRHTIGSVLAAQKVTLCCAFILAGVTGVVSAAAAAMPALKLHQAAMLLMAFTPTVLTVSFTLMLMQALAALGAYAAIARAMAISSAIGIVASYVLISTLDVYALILGELIFNWVGCYMVYRYLRSRG